MEAFIPLSRTSFDRISFKINLLIKRYEKSEQYEMCEYLVTCQKELNHIFHLKKNIDSYYGEDLKLIKLLNAKFDYPIQKP